MTEREQIVGWTHVREDAAQKGLRKHPHVGTYAYEPRPLMGSVYTRNKQPMEKVAEPCKQQATGSCYGCPVMNEIYERASETAQWSPKSIGRTIREAAIEAKENACPEEVAPQTDLLAVRVTDRGIGDRVGSVRMRRKL
jgi:hypothetical protein